MAFFSDIIGSITNTFTGGGGSPQMTNPETNQYYGTSGVVGDPAAVAPTSVNVVAGDPGDDLNKMNVADYSGQLVGDPSLFFNTDNPQTSQNESMFLQEQAADSVMTGTEAGTNINPADARFDMDASATNATATTVGEEGTATSGGVEAKSSATYDVANTFDKVNVSGMQAADGTVSQGAIIDANEVPQADVEATALGQNAVGKALQDYASQGIANVIDTSTVSGKLLAQQLGEGNYTDYKATVQGQLSILSEQFTDNQGNPTIPTWAAGTARNVSRIAAFKGVTGTAATAAMSQAIMEASLPIAQADASFFQTVTLQNLDNKQQSTINRANVLSKMELANLDNRMAAAVQNSKNFMDMDLTNLANEQQARVINTQSRVQAILEDAKQENAKRLFVADSENEMNKYYDNLNASIEQFNASQLNSMAQFDADSENTVSMFNSDLENQREQFYRNMQYNIDTANAQWRQTVTLSEDQQAFDAAATDVKNLVGVSLEQLNQIWDRSDALLDYIWQSSEKGLDRELSLVLQKLKSESDIAAADAAGEGSMWGSVLGAGTSIGLKWAFGL